MRTKRILDSPSSGYWREFEASHIASGGTAEWLNRHFTKMPARLFRNKPGLVGQATARMEADGNYAEEVALRQPFPKRFTAAIKMIWNACKLAFALFKM